MGVVSAGVTDAEVLAAIHRAAFHGDAAWGPDVFRLQLTLPGVAGLLHPAGGLALWRKAADEAELLSLAVAPSARRRGIGRELVEQVLAGARCLGVHALFLEVSVSNVAAQALYRQAGFEKVGNRPHYYADGSDALVLRRELWAD